MDLNEQKFSSILHLLQQADSDVSVAERRTYPRIPMQKCLAVIPYRDGEEGELLEVWMRDISQGGIGLVHNQPMQRGEEFIVHLPERGTETRVLCRVTYCAPLIGKASTGLYGVGARFVEEMPK
jgi:Tfp pilus assembly protein PilZ